MDLLGIPTISWNGSRIILVRRQARAILFRLAFATAPVGREELADLLWPDKEPALARRNLVRLLSSLRGELPHRDLLLADRAAVWLDPAHLTCDIQEFSDLSQNGNAGDLEKAAALYRGPFLSGFVLSNTPTFDEWQQSAGYGLERQYLQALSSLVQELTSQGVVTKAIDYANQYLAVDELAETMHRALITLYAAAGRRTDALQQYSRCVQILHHELGVEPLPETRAAFEAARDGAAGTPPHFPSEPVWSTLPGLDLPLTGRKESWYELEQAYQLRRPGGAILIGGAPGIGKSRLMQEFASQHTGRVLVGNCQTGSQTLPFQPLVQALRQALQMGQLTEQLKVVWLAELSLLMPELRDQVADLPVPLRLSPAKAQTRLFEALMQAFRSLAGAPGLLLCLDDLHAADQDTLDWLTYATGQLATSRICLLITFREQEAAPLALWRRSLSRSGMGTVLRLGALTHESVTELLVLTGVKEEIAAVLAPRLHRATGGNAFFLLETIRELIESNEWLTASLTVPLPETVREVVLRRTDRLDPLARQVLDMAAVLSPLLEIRLLAETSARSELEVAEALDELVLRQFLLPEDGRFRFQHDLTQEAVYGAISEWRQRLLHRRAAQAIAQTAASAEQNLLGMVAQHYELAMVFDQALQFYQKAAVAAREVYANQEAIRFLRRGIDLLSKVKTADQIAIPDLHEALADLLMLTGDYAGAREAIAQSIKALPGSCLLDQSRLTYKLGRSWSKQMDFAAAEKAYDDAEALLEGTGVEEIKEKEHLWINIELALADLYYLHNRWDEMLELCDAVREPVSTNGSLRQQADFYSALVMLNNRRMRYTPSPTSVANARRALTIAEKMDDKILTAHKTFSMGFQLLWFGDLDQAQKLLSESYAQAEEIGDLALQNRAITYLTITYRLLGDAATVHKLVQKALQSTKEERAKMYIGAAQANSAWIEYCHSRFDQSVIHADAALKNWSNLAYPFTWLARLVLLAINLERGRLEMAVEQARYMNDVSQQKLADPIYNCFEEASRPGSVTQKAGATKATLRKAVALAKKEGYL